MYSKYFGTRREDFGWFFRPALQGVFCVEVLRYGIGSSPSLCMLRTCFTKGGQIVLSSFACWCALIVSVS